MGQCSDNDTNTNPSCHQVAELKLMKTLLVEPHPNVVRLLGCCTAASDKEPTYLIMEYVAKGKLQEFLRRYASIRGLNFS